MSKIALFPGSFDPFTLGHYAIVEQGLKVFDKIVIGIGANGEKRGLLTTGNKLKLIESIYPNQDRVEAVEYYGLTGDYCREKEIKFILRGMRNTVDYECERNMMLINQKLYPEITTVLLFTPPEYVSVSSSIIRELLHFGKDPSELLPQNIDIKKYL